MTDGKPTPTPDDRSGSVRTPIMVASCPICGRPLKGKQTVCSGKCRVAKWRRDRDDKLKERDAKDRLLLTEALGLLTETNRSNRGGGGRC